MLEDPIGPEIITKSFESPTDILVNVHLRKNRTLVSVTVRGFQYAIKKLGLLTAISKRK